jgi:ribosomal protein L9
MKVILQEHVKGKGKAGQTIEVPSGYGLFLVREQKAVLATQEALNAMANDEAKAHAKEVATIDQMKSLSLTLANQPVRIAMKVGVEGKTFGAVSSKQIIQAFQEQHQLTLDKKKIQIEQPINSLGRYLVPIQLHKEVMATLLIDVVEE